MIYQAVVIFFMIGTPAPMQFDFQDTATTTTECYAQATVLLREIVKSAPHPVISAQGFCLNKNIKKKDTMPPPKISEKEDTGDSNI